MSANSRDQSSARIFVVASALSCGFAMLLGSGGGLATSIGFGAVGLVMPVLSTALLTIVLVTGEPWVVVDNHWLPRTVLAVVSIVTIAGSVMLLWRLRHAES